MIRLLTYNIHGCIGRGGRHQPDAILEVIRESNAEVVALQEVFDEGDDDLRLLESLEDLGYRSVMHDETMDTPRGPYGNVLIQEGLFHPLESGLVIRIGREIFQFVRVLLQVVEGELGTMMPLLLKAPKR